MKAAVKSTFQTAVRGVVLAAGMTGALAGCADAKALGSARQVVIEPVPVTAPVVATPDVDINDPAEGHALGLRNGRILVDRLVKATVGRYGCSAVPQLEAALLNVTHRIHAPDNHDGRFTLAFFKGYLRALREGIQQTRQGCGAVAYDDGTFAGALYGNVLCSVTSIDVELAAQLDVRSLYDGWAGGQEQVIGACRSILEITVEECAGAESLIRLSAQLEQSCQD